jgi:hypothetical protein
VVAHPLLSPARRLACLAPAALALAACAPNGPETAAAGAPAVAPAVAATGELPLKHDPRPTTGEITAADLMTRIYVFADDSMQGREAGTPGNDRGNAYIERELRRLGLQPAGEGGTYFQTVPLARRGADTTSTLSVGGQRLAYGTEFLPANARGTLRPMSGRGLAVVYGGELGAPSALTREQLAGKVVLLSMPQAFRATLRIQPDEPLAAAAGVLLTGLERMPAAARRVHTTPSIGLSAAAGTPPIPLQVFVTTALAERVAGGPLAGRAVGAPGALTLDARVAFGESPAPARNIVAVLPGSDAALRGQYVAVGAHNDHVGIELPAVDHDSLKAYNAAERRARVALDADGDEVLTAAQSATLREQVAAIRVNVDSLRRLRPARADSIANGADDDGSGSMALLEIAESLTAARARPKRSVLFVWHTAEEKGLLGARYFADRPTVPRDSIVAQINIDMIGRGRAGDQARGGDDYVSVVGARRLSTELGELAERVNAAQARPLRFDYALDANGHPLNIYCRSDHFHYARYGIPIVFLFTGIHGDYHQVTDEPQYLDYPHYARITSYARDLLTRVADLDHRLVVDKPKPDPAGSCQQ